MLEADLRRADAFIIMYSVTDKCSFDDTSRLKFLITYAKRRKKMGKDLTLKVNLSEWAQYYTQSYYVIVNFRISY